VQDEVNQDYSEQNEVDGMKKGADRPLHASFHAASRFVIVCALSSIRATLPAQHLRPSVVLCC